MNSKQIAALKSVTNRIASLNHLDGRFSFAVQEFPYGDNVMFTATTTDSDLRWYEKSTFVLGFVGVRGGIKLKSASLHIRKMLS